MFIQVYILQVRPPPGLSLNIQVTSLLLLKGFTCGSTVLGRRGNAVIEGGSPAFYSGERQQHGKRKAVEHLLSPSHISDALYSASTVLFILPRVSVAIVAVGLKGGLFKVIQPVS